MNSNFDPVGNGRIYRDRRTGALAVDEDSIARRGFGDEEPNMGNEEPTEYAGSEEPEMQGEEDFGARQRNSYPRYDNRYDRYPSRQGQPYRQPAPYQQPAPVRQAAPQARNDKNDDGAPDNWVSAVCSGSQSADAAGEVTLTIRAQHPFYAKDVTFEGSSSGAMIKKIDFGARPVIASNGGISTAVFTPTSQLRNHLKGQMLRAGLDITVVGTLDGAGKLCAAFFGYKPGVDS